MQKLQKYKDNIPYLTAAKNPLGRPDNWHCFRCSRDAWKKVLLYLITKVFFTHGKHLHYYKSHYLMVVFPNHHKTDFIPQNDTTSWNRSGTSKLLHKSLPEYSNSLNSLILTKKSYVRAICALYRPPQAPIETSITRLYELQLSNKTSTWARPTDKRKY